MARMFHFKKGPVQEPPSQGNDCPKKLPENPTTENSCSRQSSCKQSFHGKALYGETFRPQITFKRRREFMSQLQGYMHMTLRDVPEQDRPRERMLREGAQALSDAELLAVLLRTGTHRESAVILAQRMLKEAGGLSRIPRLSVKEMTGIRGIGETKALQIHAGIELGRRLARLSQGDRPVIRSPRDAAALVMEEMRHLQKEHFVVLFLNTKNHVIAQETLSMGSLNASLVHPREVFRSAIRQGSASIICIHNHPSGDPTPSREDIALTNRLVEAGNIIGIEVLDHLIIGDGIFISLKEQGHL